MCSHTSFFAFPQHLFIQNWLVFVCVATSGVARGGSGGRGPWEALERGRRFGGQKLIFERRLKVLVFRYYFKKTYISNIPRLFIFHV